MRRTPSTSSTTAGARTSAGAASGRHEPAGTSTSTPSWAVLSPTGPPSPGSSGEAYDGSHASTYSRTPTWSARPLDPGRAAGVLGHLEAHRDALGQGRHVGDHADHAVAPGGEILQSRRHRVQRG